MQLQQLKELRRKQDARDQAALEREEQETVATLSAEWRSLKDKPDAFAELAEVSRVSYNLSCMLHRLSPRAVQS